MWFIDVLSTRLIMSSRSEIEMVECKPERLKRTRIRSTDFLADLGRVAEGCNINEQRQTKQIIERKSSYEDRLLN